MLKNIKRIGRGPDRYVTNSEDIRRELEAVGVDIVVTDDTNPPRWFCEVLVDDEEVELVALRGLVKPASGERRGKIAAVDQHARRLVWLDDEQSGGEVVLVESREPGAWLVTIGEDGSVKWSRDAAQREGEEGSVASAQREEFRERLRTARRALEELREAFVVADIERMRGILRMHTGASQGPVEVPLELAVAENVKSRWAESLGLSTFQATQRMVKATAAATEAANTLVACVDSTEVHFTAAAGRDAREAAAKWAAIRGRKQLFVTPRSDR